MLPRVNAVLFAFALLCVPLARAGCLDETPKPNADIGKACSKFGNFAVNRGAYADTPYEDAPDGWPKEHRVPVGPSSELLDFTKANTGKLAKLITDDLPKPCAYYYGGTRYDLSDSKQRMTFLLKRNKASPFDKVLLDQVVKRSNHMTVRDLAKMSRDLADAAQKLGDKIFKDQLIPHAGSLDESYQKDYLRKMRLVIASLGKEAVQYQPSDCDYLNAPINHLYGLIQLARLTARMVKTSCPADYDAMKLEASQQELRVKVDQEWAQAANVAVTGSKTQSSATTDAGNR